MHKLMKVNDFFGPGSSMAYPDGYDVRVQRPCRETPPAMTKLRLVSITNIINTVLRLSSGQLSMDEITDALNKAMDGNTMIYDGSWKGLCPAIDGNPDDKNSGFNRRQDIISEFFNSKYWKCKDYLLNGIDGKIEFSEFMVMKEEAVNIASKLWSFFYPNNDVDIDAALEFHSAPIIEQVPSDEPLMVSKRAASAEDSVSGINSKIFKRLMRAIAAFPVRYPTYQTKTPKLGDDVRVWLKEVSLAENDREAHVFGAIIVEHFNLLGDTQKTP